MKTKTRPLKITLAIVILAISILTFANPASAEVIRCTDRTEAIGRIYRSAFDRFPDAVGLAYWDEVGKTRTLTQIASYFTQSPEYAAGNPDIVARMYANVLRRTPDAAGYSYWSGLGLTEGELLYYFSSSPEARNDPSAYTCPSEIDIYWTAYIDDGTNLELYLEGVYGPYYEGDFGITTDPGMKAITIEVSIINVSPVEYQSIDWHYSLRSPEGFTYNPIIFFDQPDMNGPIIYFNQPLRGFLTFEVPDTMTKATLLWNGFGEPNPLVNWHIQVPQ